MNYLGVVHDIASLNLKDKRSFVLFHVNVLWLHSITSVIMDTIALFVWACLADKPWLISQIRPNEQTDDGHVLFFVGTQYWAHKSELRTTSISPYLFGLVWLISHG